MVCICAAKDQVRSGTAVDKVLTRPCVDRIVAGLAEDLICPGAAVKLVAIRAAIDDIGPVTSVELIRPCIAIQRIVAAKTFHAVIAGIAIKNFIQGRSGNTVATLGTGYGGEIVKQRGAAKVDAHPGDASFTDRKCGCAIDNGYDAGRLVYGDRICRIQPRKIERVTGGSLRDA